MEYGLNMYHLPSLSFKNKALEEKFSGYYFRANLGHGRFCHVLALVFYLGDGIRDFILFPEFLPQLLTIRYGIMAPMFITGLIFSYLNARLYQAIWQPLFAFYFLVAGAGVHTMAIIIPQPYGPMHYMALIYCLVFGYTFIRLRFLWASFVGLLLTSAYLVAVLVVLPQDTYMTWIQLPFVVGVNFLGMFVAFTMEYIFRRHFLLLESYRQNNEELDSLNKTLEHRVEERTLELEQTNRALKQNIDELHSSEAERYKLESQLRQAYKMESIGTLAGGIAHDFNNILASILGFTELAMDDVKKESRLKDNLREVFKAGNRAKDLVRQILAFARQSDEECNPIQIGPIVKEVTKLLRSSLPSNIEIVCNIESESFITGDPVNVHQILMNLCTNAGHAMQDGGRLGIRLSDTIITPKGYHHTTGPPPGNYVELTISDTGEGIPHTILDNIFEPYFTTKGPGEGTGMGLAMVYGIVKNYGGDIQVNSKPGRGTTFRVFFPVSASGNVTENDEPETLPGGTEHILFIDDEPAIAKMSSLMLERLGYAVTVQTSSVDALKLFRSDPEAFDLVITDMMMPAITGDRMALELLIIRPDIPVILCTGYSNKMSDESAADLGIKALVFKPVIKSDLARTVRRVLDNDRDAPKTDIHEISERKSLGSFPPAPKKEGHEKPCP